ncbi:MAG: BON domain-containing protein [Myxococcota bacterium]
MDDRRRWEARRRAGWAEPDRGGWDDPVVRGEVPQTDWERDDRFAREARRDRTDRFDRESTSWQRDDRWGRDDRWDRDDRFASEPRPAAPPRFRRPRGGMDDDGRRGAYTGWGYEREERLPRRTYWYGRDDDSYASGDRHPADREPHLRRTFGSAYGAERDDAFAPVGPLDDPHSLASYGAFRVARGPHAGKGPRGFERNWDRVRDEVCDLLERDGEIDASDIDVRMDRGVVLLTGTVADRHQKRRAEHLIDGIPQVHDVRNELRLADARSERHGLSVNGTDHGVQPVERP